MGDHSRGTHQLPHIRPLILTSYISQKPLFLPKNSHPKSCFFHTVQNFGNCSLKDPKSAGKKVPKCPYFYGFCHWKTPIFCVACKCLRGMLLPQTRSEAVDFGNKLCILIFIILSIWPNFFDPPHLLLKTFWSPPFATQNFFGPPLHFAQPPPPPRYLWILPKTLKVS